MDLHALYPKCPHCGSRIGFFNRIEHCAYSDELLCNKCIVSGRFSENVVNKIPPEYREKFRIYNILPWLILTTIALLFLQGSWYRFGGWALYDLDALLDGLIYLFGFMLGGIVLILIARSFPHLGTWMFYWWVSIPKNKKKIEDAVKQYEEERYVSPSKLYRLKTQIFEFFKDKGVKLIYLICLICNLLMIPFFFIMTYNDNLAGSYFSSFVGVVWVLTMIFSFIVIAIGAGFYSHRIPENKAQRRNIAWLSGLYVLCLPLIYFSFLFGNVWKLNAFSELIEELADVDFGFLLPTYQILFVFQIALISFLCLYLYKWAKPLWYIQEFKKTAKKLNFLGTLKKIIKSSTALVFLILLIALTAICIVFLTVDPAMAFGILAPTYILMGICVPVIFTTLKLLPRRRKKYTQIFWVAVKMSIVIVSICSVPAIMTPLWTNTSLENQFQIAFGPDYMSKIPSDVKAKFRQTPYSAFENYFGFDISYEGAALYDVVYCQDHPRYVKQGGVILSNGSEKYTPAIREFTFDCYLPPGEQFGTGTTKYPVIIFCHGIGMSKGTGNANFSVSRYFANQGYLVCDMEYGRTGWVENGTNIGNRGYDFPDTVRQVANFTKYLKDNEDYYHADMDNIWFAGRSFGGWMATILAYGYNLTFFQPDFASDMTVRGCIPFYGAIGITDAGELLTLDLLEMLDVMDTSAPYIRGSPDPSSPDYNEEWFYFNPYEVTNPAKNGGSNVCPTLMIHGTQDPLVPPGWDIRMKQKLESYGQIGILGLYPMGSHATDVIHWGQYGQSVLYYMERFLALTRFYV